MRCFALFFLPILISSQECKGFDKCPDFPLPYNGTYPDHYDYGGKFPDNFIWGLGTASYQVEGAYNTEGRGASIWDTFSGVDTVGMVGSQCSQTPCPINDGMFDKGATGAVADDQYHRFEQDVKMMKNMKLPSYRFSIAWPRLVPTGKVEDGINNAGLEYYNSLIDQLVEHGIKPVVTLYHWDLPQALLDEQKGTTGWYSVGQDGRPDGKIIPHFVDFADLCFRTFGDRVKTWITFNEAWTFTWLGSGGGKAPSIPQYNNVSKWPYIAGHNVIMAHAHVMDLYKTNYSHHNGSIAMTNNVDWAEPKTSDPLNVGASARTVLFHLGWFADPIYFGDYPDAMKRLLGDKLPTFTPAESSLLLKNKPDFFGLNHYGSGFATNSDEPGSDFTYQTMDHDGLQRAQSIWLYSAPWGFRKLLNWVHKRYSPPGGIVVTENGWSVAADNPKDGVKDPSRVAFYANYTSEMLRAITEDKVDVRGYFAWSLMDNYEWERGYTERFGLVFNDYSFGTDKNSPTNQDHQPTPKDQRRYLKDSACWFMEVWKFNSMVDPNTFKGCSQQDRNIPNLAA
mmetsp:Transcript_15880/g.31117  ORF Transcript_15880/g.31117 Transcript_15880/m.31117 type:complete len:565 (+) Transcript_15880:37-1731(+)|eukprot:CAMPEP_0175137922 /NCGR_PEP_ID=MMETSP0087-20121206/10068_1 /TAXON_ID=136419 /ORGANISM="Unknown Unknown, Strain D1" /LENGTH=564 /DNA_ID=CAMNT_0016420779 /DNA_START=37 /DNA_END=1731 /DNA_ORIENTATION=+